MQVPGLEPYLDLFAAFDQWEDAPRFWTSFPTRGYTWIIGLACLPGFFLEGASEASWELA